MSESNEFVKISNPCDVKYVADLEPLPPNDERYVSLDEIRMDLVPRDLYRALKAAALHPAGKCAHICYAGHRGNGKTTELFKVLDRLKEEGLFHSVYQAADADFASADLDYPDIMLYLAKMALEGMPAKSMPEETLLEPIEDWFAEQVSFDRDYHKKDLVIEGKAQAGLRIPGLLKLLTGLTSSIKGGHQSMKQTRHVLRQRVSDLIDRLNDLFGVLKTSLSKAGASQDLLLVVDNLDRLDPEIMEQGFSRWASLFHQLRVHLIITVPLPLIYHPDKAKLSEMGFRPFVLSMPKIRAREQNHDQFWPKGVARLTDVIRARVEEEKVFKGSVKQRRKCLQRLVLVSGGSLREMIRILAYAGEEAWDEPIAMEHVETAIRKVAAELMANLNNEDLSILVRIHEAGRADRTEKEGRQLYHRWALEYNGDRWADVHPLVFQSERFREYIRREHDHQE